MTTRSAQHGTIRLERRYKAPPARVFAAWAEPQARGQWDVPGRWVIAEQTFDFREGGREVKRFGPKDDPRLVADTLYLDIVPQRRIVFSYSMTSRGTPISVSLTTIELSRRPARARICCSPSRSCSSTAATTPPTARKGWRRCSTRSARRSERRRRSYCAARSVVSKRKCISAGRWWPIQPCGRPLPALEEVTCQARLRRLNWRKLKAWTCQSTTALTFSLPRTKSCRRP